MNRANGYSPVVHPTKETEMQPYSFPFSPWSWREAVEARVPGNEEAAGDRDRPDGGLLGYEVEALDGRIGEIDHANAELPADCLVVDTGTWLTSHRVVLPIGAVERADHQERRLYVDRTKYQVKEGPEYDPDSLDATTYRRRLADYYSESYRMAPPARGK